jgi:FlaA1/EpsC-like NDP-sugar epimerase
MGLSFSNLSQALIPAIIMSIFVLVGNPLIVMIILGFLGYRKRTSFMAGLTVAQISEFSLIIVLLGKQVGHLSDLVISIITIVAMITFTLSTYAIIHSRKLYELLEPFLRIFERKRPHENGKSDTKVTNHTVIVGAHRLGMNMIEILGENETSSLVIVDFDPDRAKKLTKRGLNVIFGDIADDDVRERANIENAKLIVTTVPDIEDNIILIQNARRENPDVTIIAMAQYDTEIQDLYLAGASYVIMPYGLVGRILGKVIKDQSFELLEHQKSPLQLEGK